MAELIVLLLGFAGPTNHASSISVMSAQTVSQDNDFPPGEDGFPEGEDPSPGPSDETVDEPMPEGADGSLSDPNQMPVGEDPPAPNESGMPAGEDGEESSDELPPLAPVQAMCVTPLRARGIIKITGKTKQSIDLNEARVEGAGSFGKLGPVPLADGCIARAQFRASVNERCDLRMDLIEQNRGHLQASSIRLLGHGCPDVELPEERFLMSSGQVHFEISGELTESCVNKARLQATGSAELRAGTGETLRLEFIDFAIEGDLPGQWDSELTCARRGRPLDLGLDQSQATARGSLWKPLSIAAAVLVVGGGAAVYYSLRPDPTTRIVIDLR